MTGPRIGSLCSGYGGLDMGVQAVYGGTVAWHVEYDRDPSKILHHHWPHIPNHGDVKTTNWADVEPVDILTAGYPCQPFSHAGKRKGTDDPRHLWPDVARAIGVLRPRLVVLENVRGHVSLGLADVLADLSGLGYDATWGVVRAADAGAPHGRARIFIVGGPTDADALGRARGGRTRGGWRGPADDDQPAPHPGSERHGRGQDGGGLGRLDGPDAGTPRERERPRGITVDRGPATTADTAGAAGRGPQPERLAPARRRTTEPQERPSETRWGAYSAAVARWEHILGRPAPDPTEPGRNGPRLSPAFVEWMMGLPAGHVTAVPDLSRNAQLKALGNGVVPQQAALALRLLAEMEAAA